MSPRTASAGRDLLPAPLQDALRLIDADEPDAALRLIRAFRNGSLRERIEAATLEARCLEMLGDLFSARRVLIPALRLAGDDVDLKIRVRFGLSLVLIRAGDCGAAEEVLKRALTEVQLDVAALPHEVSLLRQMALVRRRRGALTEAENLYRESLRLAARRGQTSAISPVRLNLAVVLVHRAGYVEAGAILRELAARPALPQFFLAHVHLAMALLALHESRFDECSRALALAGELSSGRSLRVRSILEEYTADLLLARGDAAAARDILVPLLERVEASIPFGDLVPEVARRLAGACLALGDAEAGLRHARHAIQTGRRADVLEQAAGLRVAGECCYVLGEVEEGRRCLAEARAVLLATEFAAERARLDATLRRLGVAEAPHEGVTSASPEERAGGVGDGLIRLPLRDGRELLCCDPALIESVRIAANDTLPVLVEGETGTGKELVARAIHEGGPRGSGPFVVVDGAALAESLAEAELFGAARGAYSGAVADRPGLVAAADGGTLFVDELASLSTAAQSKLLRLLQEGTYRRLGEVRERRVNLRVIAAVNMSAETLVREGVLKPDLFHRLNAHRIRLRPLRERCAEIGPLALRFASRVGITGIQPGALERMTAHDWPGNVRELEMLVRVCARHAGPDGWLDESVLSADPRFGRPPATAAGTPLESARRRGEAEVLARALRDHGGNAAAAARSLGMSRQAFSKAARRAGIA